MALKINPKLRKFVRSYISLKRYNHCVRVAEFALELAEKYNVDREKTINAAMLHDIAREMSIDKMWKWASKYYEIDTLEQKRSVLIHGKAGAAIARDEYGINDPDILEAIMYHTTGKPGMSDLAKIILIADSIEPRRKHSTDELRNRIIDEPINEALSFIIKDQVEYLKQKKKAVADVTAALYVELTHGVDIVET